MKKLVTTFGAVLFAAFVFAQQNPVSWATKAEKVSAGTYKISITATFSNPWHLYSQSTPADGPVPTKFTFSKNPLLTFVGTPEEKGELKKMHDKNFGDHGVDVKYYSNKVVFVQTVKVKGNIKTNVSGSVYYMVCNDHECLPPRDQSFSVNLQ